MCANYVRAADADAGQLAGSHLTKCWVHFLAFCNEFHDMDEL
jgi:hypothetical protein